MTKMKSTDKIAYKLMCSGENRRWVPLVNHLIPENFGTSCKIKDPKSLT